MFNKKNSQAVGWISMTDIFMLFTVLLFMFIIIKNRVQDELDTSETAVPIIQACCIGDKCSDVIQKICSELGGTSYSGECSLIDCKNYSLPEQFIGCCFDGIMCHDMISEVCIANDGVILTNRCGTHGASHCRRVDEPKYACCVGGDCLEVTKQECNDIAGEYSPDKKCSDVECIKPDEKYSCCINGNCIELSEADCYLVNGTVHKFWNCNNVNCPDIPVPPDRFACCVGGDCIEVTKQECNNIAGEYHPDKKCVNITCSRPISKHACCINGDCIELEQSKCVNVNGTIFFGRKCSDVTCPKPAVHAPRYACCINGDCIEIDKAGCLTMGGEFSPGEKCTQVVCKPFDSGNELPVELFGLTPPFKNVVFLVDKSSGMGQNGIADFVLGGGAKWQHIKDTIKLWLEYLPIEEAAVVMFNQKDPPDRYPSFDKAANAYRLQNFSNMSLSSRKKAIAKFITFLGNSTGGQTDISLGFKWALKYETSSGERPDAIIFFSDGLPTTISAKKTLEILKKIAKDIPIHIVGTGDYFDQDSLDFFSEILSLNEKNSWRGTDGILKQGK